MSHARGFDPDKRLGKPPGRKRGRPPKWSGPASTLSYSIQTEVVAQLRRGATRRMAASLAGTSPKHLENWLRRGRDAIEAGKRSRYTELVQDVEKAEAEYQMSLIEASTAAIADKTMNDKVIRWRLAVADREFRAERERAAAAGDAQGPFELVKPEDAQQALVEKLERFLAESSRAESPDADESPEAQGEEEDDEE
ncbi:helix-turn-helix domain-containing protein [Corallococcus macrosporus]|uniref:Uncharacterized protein n=1 Tax=Myxococcus fulvus (strain ATCC BAA-855 / HW-1) TaxID=483219 RepID=F8C801_MYXFH|nr:helix-turn-helix domain-containing protein [Corallococcus macrosporus]AEI66953.1 hypothetical protein LILAB_25300 [Corallococcus macrosporus]